MERSEALSFLTKGAKIADKIVLFRLTKQRYHVIVRYEKLAADKKGVCEMTQISLSDLKYNTGKYVTLAQQQDVFITKNGKVVAKLTTAKMDKVAAAEALFGIIPPDVDLKKAKEERLGL